MSSPSTPKPTRPTKSERRLTLESISSIPLSVDTDEIVPPVPTSPFSTPSSSSSSSAPQTPETPTATHKKLDNRKSTCSIKRKPVPTTPSDLSLELDSLPTSINGLYQSPLTSTPVSVTPDNEPPRYILPVDLPIEAATTYQIRESSFTSTQPPSYDHHHTPQESIDESNQDLSDSTFSTSDDLPCYAEETQTEPKTLARALWRWGWLCPLLWIIGMFILWIPLKPIEEESDPEKAQKLEEMIVILRKTEVRYARKCAYGTLGFSTLLILITVIAIVLSKYL
ncbi:uncharacterized protein L201_007398 [Kwoniella dendrophila CBS 6074]|uniref:Uncharacterized protein n=1 Tax=Kwoniella dendrophila CBS 6074 TaxID=1295534 RepID=A0AAX4K4A1_9TREE